MLLPGLVSVTFRQLPPRDVVSLAQQARLSSIEWGGDVHVPHGDLPRAREARALTQSAGLTCCSYGSYYRLASATPTNPPFETVLYTAVALGTPLIRVWPGSLGSADATPAYRAAVANDARRICTLAATANIRIALEYHTKTLTDTSASAQQLLRDADHPNLSLLWQPTPGMPPADRLAGLQLALPTLANLHVYHYTGTAYAPLSAIAAEWATYFSLARTTNRTHHCLLEFVRDDSPETFLEDAATLHRLLDTLTPPPPPSPPA